MPQSRVVTTALSLARELWRYGEPDLVNRALSLTPEAVLSIGSRAFPIYDSFETIWPGGPKRAYVVLAAIEYLEGVVRPCARRTRLPETRLPEYLQASEAQRWAALAPITTRRAAERGDASKRR
jgi:hypothetical protein